MEPGNENDFAQHIGSNGTGYQNYYSGQRHQIFTGSGTIHNYNAAYAGIGYSRERIMQDLYTSPYQQRKNRNPDRVPGTCEWFTHHDNFHRWQDSMSSSMLWVSANPGCGKSVLAKYLVDKLKTTELRTTCYFFFKDDFEDQRSAKAALSCILHQLFIQREHLLSAEIVKRFMSYKALRASSYHELWELWDILTMIAQKENAGEIICILDAFDECIIHERQELAKILREFYGSNGDTKQMTNLKFLITSRPYDTIRRDLIRPFEIQDCPVIHLKGEGDAEVEKIVGEISLYIRDKVSRIRANLDLTPKEEDILLKGLEAVPNQTYLWVYLTLEWIETEISNKINETEIRNAISILPQTVDEAYDKILARSTDIEETKKLLHIVVAAERPLTLAEMDLALAIREHHKSYKDLALRPSSRVRNYIRDLCGLFINVTDEKIYLLHQTAKEFLVPNNNADSLYNLAQRVDIFRKGNHSGLTWKLSLNPTESHRILCKICIWHILFTEFETQPPTRASNVTMYLRQNLFLEYSAKNWATHFNMSSIKENEILEQLHQICNVTLNSCPTWFKIYWTNIHTDFPSNFTKLMIASYFGLETVVRLQLESSNDIIDAVEGTYERSALSWASENGFHGVVQLLISGPNLFERIFFKKTIQTFSRSVDVNARDRYGRTPLTYAAWNGHLDIVRRLVKAKALVDLADEIKGTPISYALCYGQEDIVTELMKGAQPDSVDEIRRELLLSAAIRGHEPVVKRLLNSGADPTVADDEGASLLILATKAQNTNIVELLIEGGADPGVMDHDGVSLIILAIKQGNTKLAELLIEKGADLEVVDCDGNSLVILAIKQGNTKLAELLIEKGADTDVVDCYGVSLMALATQQKNMKLVKLLVERGADPEVVDHDGVSLIILATEQGDVELVKLLIKRGADLKVVDRNGNSLIILAVEQGNMELTELLIERGADLEVVDYAGVSLIALATKRGNIKLVKLLIEGGADVNKGDRGGITPLVIAMRGEKLHMVEMLLKGGAKLDYTFNDIAPPIISYSIYKSKQPTPLLYAIYQSDKELVRLLLRYGANPNFQGVCRSTPLETAKHNRDKLLADEMKNRDHEERTRSVKYMLRDEIVYMLEIAID